MLNDFVSRLQAALESSYRVDRELPIGGLGRVFLAVEAATAREVAVQVLPPDIASETDEARFRAAIGRASELRHPNLLSVVAAGAYGDLLYCISPYLHGESLRNRLAREGSLPVEDAATVLHDIADALAYAHGKGVPHGDLEPQHIVFDEARAVLTGFGVAYALEAARSGAPPAIDVQRDLRAIAAIGYEMLTGKPPFVAQEVGGETPTPVAELRPDAPATVSAAITRALSDDAAHRFESAAQFRDAIGVPVRTVRRRRGIKRRWAAVVTLILVAGLVWTRATTRVELDPNLVVVAPFQILDPAHALWREGLVDVLSANLDGAGPLRTVSPTLAVRRWNGRADKASATALGRKTGARLAVFGRVERTGSDSVRLFASLVDVASKGALAEIEIDEPQGRMDRLADSVTVALLRALSRTRPISAVRLASLGSSSLPAVKSFLQGEQHYRRTAWDSAIVYYQRAIELDSTFALPLYRVGIILGWQSSSGDSLSRAYLLRAAAHTRGLPARDSMLVIAESLGAAVDEGRDNPLYWTHYRRLYATTLAATRRYPDDPEVWYELGETRYHYPVFSTRRQMLDAFNRAIALDSAFAPAYIHPIELALHLEGPAAAKRYLDAYLELHPRDIYADAIRLTRELLDPRRARSQEVQGVLDTASADLLDPALANFRGWADTSETEIRLLRLRAQGRPSAHVAAESDSTLWLLELSRSLAYHGHLREASAIAGHRVSWLFVALAMLGGVDPDTAAEVFARSLRGVPNYPRSAAFLAAPWWASRGDTASLRALARRADSTARAPADALERGYARYVADGARAFEALARHDTTEAIRGLAALPDTACQSCVGYRVARAQLLEAAHRDREAAGLLAGDAPGFVHPTDGLWMLLRARVAERTGDRATAIASYRFVRDVWLRADAVLQPYVTEARQALARLGAPR